MDTTSNFDLFNEIYEISQQNLSTTDEPTDETTSVDHSVENSVNNSDDDGENCRHLNIINEKDMDICTNCGQEIKKNITFTRDWRYCQKNDTKCVDPLRVQKRRNDERTIYKDVENMNFSDRIVSIANKIYFEITKEQIFRGNSRKAIVFACIFHSYKLTEKPQTHEKLIDVFGLSTKIGLKGIKYVNLYTSKNKIDFDGLLDVKPSVSPITYITPVNLVEEIMDKFNATKEQKQQVVSIYHKIKNRSSRLNRSRPQSVASALVYYWICENKINISLKQFAKTISLSDLTINKLYIEIVELFKNKKVI